MCYNIYRRMYRRQRSAGKNVLVLLSILLTKAMFIVRAHTTNLKQIYVRVVPFTCVRSVHKLCGPDDESFWFSLI